MSSYTDYTDNNAQSNINDEKKSTTSFGQPKHILLYLAIALAIIVFLMIMCIIIVSYRRKSLRQRTNIGSITHLRNVDDEEYNSLDYYLNDYSNNYIDEKKRRFTKPRLPKANMADLSMRGNRNYKIYAKNNTTVHDEDDDDERDNIEVTINTVIESNSTSYNNNNKLKGIKSLSDIMKSSKNKFLARNNTTGNFDLKSKNDSSLDTRISSPVTSVSTSIYNNERANSLADNSNSRTAPVVPPVPTIPSHKKLMEISRGSQMTTVSNDENNLNKTNHNTFTTINFSETNENITDNFTDNFATTTNPYVISPNDLPASTSHGSKLKKSGKLQNMAIDSLYLLKRSNHSPFVPESQNNNKAKEKEEEKEYEIAQEEKEEKENKITKEDEDEDEENSNKVMVNEMILSRESNLYRKNLYMIT